MSHTIEVVEFRSAETGQSAPSIKFAFDGPTAVGEILCIPGDYGLYLQVNGQIVAMLDLYHYGKECNEDPMTGEPATDLTDYPAMAIFSRALDDPIAHVSWLPGGTQIAAEWPCQVKRDEVNRSPILQFLEDG